MTDFHPSETDDQVFPELFTRVAITARKLQHALECDAAFSPPVELEPARFATTGAGYVMGLRSVDSFYGLETGCIDAPQYIPVGSVHCAAGLIDGKHYLVTTDGR